ncbi:conserved oligomeric Golgi complex subunit 8 [Paragonimus westermani]|uniref:Conserved oligomeric Golgi complex subunit 8 n=1 Tax=Paragonimus westermani TaxID=34504 RepID=A0A5J4NU38_9TREM|nr:conserved oligomeric Golgi complex subunit 8 [Paragonimus westermani]
MSPRLRTVFSERELTTKLQQPDPRAADWTFLNGNTTTLSTNPLCLTADLQGNEPSRFSTNLLHAWLIHRIGVFLDTFAADVQQMLHQPSLTIQEVVDRWSSMGQSGSSADTTPGSDLEMEALFTNLQSLISQSMYFGRSFSRIGCDFRPHLVDLFYNAVSSYVKVFLNNATDEFSIALDNLLWKATNTFLDDPNDVLSDEVINNHCSPDKKTTFPPADDLLPYPPLVVLYNRIMELFNGLRVCCPVGLKHRLATLIADCLTSASSRVATSYRLLVDQQSVNWRSDAADLASGFYSILVPNVISSMCSQLLSATQSEACSEQVQSRVQILVQYLARFVCEPMEKNWPRIPSYDTTTLRCIPQQKVNSTPLANEDARSTDESATSRALVENHLEEDCASDVN